MEHLGVTSTGLRSTTYAGDFYKINLKANQINGSTEEKEVLALLSIMETCVIMLVIQPLEFLK